ncbi:MAG: hypothetical protein ACI4JW_09565 [Oscillospiraceae bacterium]
MKKMFKTIAASVSAFVIAASMAISASAADSTAADVVSAAKAAGVPSNHVAELKNYLDSHASKFSAADYDYMIKQLSDTGATYVQPAADKLYGEGTDLSSLSDLELKKVFKEMGEANRKAIADACVATGAHFGVTIKVDELTSKDWSVQVIDENGNTNISTDTNGKPLSTGANGVSAVEIAAILTLALSAYGITFVVKKNREC